VRLAACRTRLTRAVPWMGMTDGLRLDADGMSDSHLRGGCPAGCVVIAARWPVVIERPGRIEGMVRGCPLAGW